MLLSVSFFAFSQQLKPLPVELSAKNPVNIFPADGDKVFLFSDRNKIIQSSFKVVTQSNIPVFVAETFAASSSHFNVQVNFKSIAPVKKADIILARFAIRSVYAKQESGDAVVYFFINQAVAPFERNVLNEINIGPEWKIIEIPFTAQYDMAAGEGTIGFTFGALSQKVEIASVEVLNFENKVTIDKLPITRFTYQGREANAAWRKAALQRIEEIRTAPLHLKITDTDGKPVAGASVEAKLVEQEFIWGTAVNEAVLGNELPHSANYKKYLKEFFNTAIIENGFKAATWQGKPERKAETMRAFEWLEKNGFRQRGHNAVWPGWKFNTALFKTTAETDTAKFRQIVEEDIRSKMLAVKGRVIAWDVINEPLHEKHFQKYLPPGIEVQWFKIAKETDPSAQLFINEYAMLNSIHSP